MDLHPLEGGGSGGGRSGTAAKIAGAGVAGTVLGTGYKALENVQDKAEKDRKAKKDTMTAGQKQSMEEAKDEETRKKTKTAPTTKTEMGKGFAKGGSASSRADGCATKGKTKGRFV
jgi:hypothetical protein